MREEGRVLDHVLMQIKMSSPTWQLNYPKLRHFPPIPVRYGTPRSQCVWLHSSVLSSSSPPYSLPPVSSSPRVGRTRQDSHPCIVAEETVVPEPGSEPEPEPEQELKVTGSFPSDNTFGRACSLHPRQLREADRNPQTWSMENATSSTSSSRTTQNRMLL